MENINVIVFQEEGAWVAHCVEVDICVQAPDLTSLQRRLDLTVRAELHQSMQRFGRPFAGIARAPDYIRERWNQPGKAFTASGSALEDL